MNHPTQTAFVLMLITACFAHPSMAASRNCRSDTVVQCRQGECVAPEPVFTHLILDYGAGTLTYCAGTACYAAKVAIVKSGREELIAFDGRRTQPGEPKAFGGLATVHPGGRTATIGRFDGDGTVSFSHLICEQDGG